MKFIAENWQALSVFAFVALAGAVLLVKGVREFRSRRSSGTNYAARGIVSTPKGTRS
jgi:hypothetical protein